MGPSSALLPCASASVEIARSSPRGERADQSTSSVVPSGAGHRRISSSRSPAFSRAIAHCERGATVSSNVRLAPPSRIATRALNTSGVAAGAAWARPGKRRAVEHCVRGRGLVCGAAGRKVSAMSTIAELDKKLNDAILSGKAMEAFEELYAEDVVMQENSEPEYRGKDFNRKREIEFFSSVEAWHGGACTASAIHGDVSFSEWTMDITLKGVGRIKMDQVAVRRWKDGKIVHERFYHK